MNLYIDKENLHSLMDQDSNSFFEICFNTIKNQLDVFMNFSKEDVVNDHKLLSFFQLMTSGVGNTKKEFLGIDIKPKRPLKSNTTNEFNKHELSAIYLISDESYDKLKNTGSVIIGKVGEELDVFKQLFFVNDGNNEYFKELRIGENEFSKWEDLQPYTTPITEIIIVDPYIIKKPGSSDNIIDVNLINWIDILCDKTTTKVNIVIVFNPSHASYELSDVKSRITKKIKNKLGKSPNVTFIKTYREHDRSIITNYLRITGNTFTYWNETGHKITNGKEIFIRSLACRTFYNNSYEVINDIQNIIDEHPENIIGDKVSNYLNFN